MAKKALGYGIFPFVLWSAYTIYIFSFDDYLRQVLSGLAAGILFVLLFVILGYVLKK